MIAVRGTGRANAAARRAHLAVHGPRPPEAAWADPFAQRIDPEAHDRHGLPAEDDVGAKRLCHLFRHRRGWRIGDVRHLRGPFMAPFRRGAGAAGPHEVDWPRPSRNAARRPSDRVGAVAPFVGRRPLIDA